MSCRPILTLWSQAALNEEAGRLLRKPSGEISIPITGEDRQDIETLVASFLNRDDALGLAAPQLGLNKRIIVFRIKSLDDKKWDKDPGDYEMLINPRLVQARGEPETQTEGCLSCPEIQAEVPRFPEIKVRAYDQAGKKINRRYQGFLARIVQHELDHLEGRLIIDAGENIYCPRKYESLFRALWQDKSPI